MSIGKLILAFGCSALFGGLLFGCDGNTDPWARVRAEPTITDWSPESTITTEGEVKKVLALNVGRVLVKRDGHRDLFSVLVIPFRKIPVGSKVEVVVVEDRQSIGTISVFFVVK